MALASNDERTWTYADYCHLPDDGKRYEIIDGRLHVNPAPSAFHQIVSGRLQFILHGWLQGTGGIVLAAPCDVFMPGADPVQPDLIVLTSEQRRFLQADGIHGAPHLLVEILSPSTAAHDRVVKLRKYVESGVAHYWVVDPVAAVLESLALQADGHYVLTEVVGRGETFRPSCFPCLEIDTDALFENLPELA